MDAHYWAIASIAAGAPALVCVFLLIVDFWLRNQLRMRHKLNEEFASDSASCIERSELFKEYNEHAQSGALSWLFFWRRLRILIDQSGLAVTPEALAAVSVGLGFAVGAVGYFVGRHWAFACFMGMLGCAAPLAYVLMRGRQRLNKLCSQLPAAFDLMSRAVRAGQTMQAAFQLVAREGKPPISEEFAYCCEMQNLGLSPEVTLRELARRNRIVELQMFATAVLVQRQTGGNPVEVLNHLSDVIRKRIRFAGRVRALTGEGRMQAIVLCVLPPVAFAAIYLLNRSYAEILLTRPKILVGALSLQAVGALWIRKIIKFEY